MKYLPGGVWHFVERVRALKKHFNEEKVINSVILEPFLMVAAALICIPLGGFQSGLGLICIFPVLSFSRNFRNLILKRVKWIKLGKYRRARCSFERC